MSLVNQVLIRKLDSNYQLVVPDVLKRRLFDQAHAGPLAAHLGFERTLAQLRDSYYWPGMSKDVRAWCNACDVCARSRGPPPRVHEKMVKVSAAAPMDLVAIDILSGLPQATVGSTCIIVVVDYMTKWAVRPTLSQMRRQAPAWMPYTTGSLHVSGCQIRSIVIQGGILNRNCSLS